MCPKCGEHKFKLIPNHPDSWDILGKESIRPVNCKCERDIAEYNDRMNREYEEKLRMERLLKSSMMNKKMESFTFNTWDDTKVGANYKKIALNYCNNWDKIKAENYGMFLYGNPGGGKTFLVSCIANELLKNNVTVAFISMISFINRVYASYGEKGENESNIINSLNNASLLIIDDLGAESGNGTKGKEILYQILDNRLRIEKPLIITSNFNVEEIKQKLDYDGIGRSADRIVEMCVPIKLENESIRKAKARDKKEEFFNVLRG